MIQKKRIVNKNLDLNLAVEWLLASNFVCFKQLLQMQYKRAIILIREYLSILDYSPCPLR